jgi:S-DNA-T family DNA segregation ATPase FtsK/SpoIIIE
LERIGLLKKKNVNEESEVLTDEVLEEDDLKVVNTITEDQKEQDIVSETVLLDGEEDEEKEVIEEESTEPETEVTVEESVVIDETSDNLETDDDTFSVTVAESPETDEEVSQDELPKNFEDMGEYDPKLDLSNYTLPPIDLLKDYGKKGVNVDKSELEANKNKIVETLANYKIEISKIMATVGPTVTLYEIVPAPGVRISKIKNLEDDIALSLAALGIRIIAPIPGKGTIGIEVPNSKPEMVSMRSLIASRKFQEADMELPVVMGKTITNETYTFDLTKMPHLLVAGATGQGKSVGLNAILVSILYKKHPAQVKFVLVDPKKVELTLYNKIERHFLAKLPDEEDAIITDTSKVVNTLNSLTIEMDERYELLKTAHCRTIKEYNAKFIKRKLNPEKGHRYLPYIVVLIDEFADLIMTAGKEVEQPIARLAQLARAIGIHLIVATQRPSVNVITGMIKANFPARIAFRVLSKIDSRTILDASGADQLIGRGDMLISTGQDLVRLQCGFVDTPEVEDICDFIGDQRAYPEAFKLPEFVGEGAEGGGSMDDEELDALFADAARIVVMHQQGSASLLQRKLKLGYNRAGRIIDQLEGMGIIGPFKGSKARDVLYSDENALEELLVSKGLV